MGVEKAGRRRTRRLGVEALEDRAVPATFGVPWGDASRLSLSFAPDGTAIAGHTSSLFQTLGALQPSATWEKDILRAFQTWAVNANINIGLVADGGQALGVAGASQHDPRFGDIRVGAQLMAADALSISVPNDPAVASTLTGDVLINTADDFQKIDLFAIMLHEAGHVFGLGDSDNPKSPLFDRYLGVSRLTPTDVAALQSLYGTRAADSHEGSKGNDSVGNATTVQPPGGWTGATPLIAYGDVTTLKDVDVYAVRPPSGYSGGLTLRLQSAGISLLAPHLSLLDAKGRVLADAQASSDLGDVITLHLDRTDPNATYFVRVSAATTDVFGIGSYGLAATFDAASTVPVSAIESVLRGPYQALSANDIDALFTSSGTLLNNDLGSDDTAASAATLSPSPGYPRNSHYETVGSMSGPTDADYYRFQTADAPSGGRPLVLTATVRSLAVNGAAPRATLIDRDGNVVPTQILANGAGTFSVQAVGVKAGGWYFLKVGPDAAAGSATTGNYAVNVQFATAAAQYTTFATGSLATDGATGVANLYIAESQLMNFVLSASPVGGTAAPGTAVVMTVRDAAGNVVYTLTANAGDTVSGPALFLTPGAYTVSFAAVGGPVAFKLIGGGISDPVGPVLTDPTMTPDYTNPGLPGWYIYPDGTISKVPYLFSPVVVV